MIHLWRILLGAGLLLAGCEKKSAPRADTSAPATTAPSASATGATVTIVGRDKPAPATAATDDSARATGGVFMTPTTAPAAR